MTDEACICGVTCCIDGEQYGYCESDSCDGMCVALGPCPCKCHADINPHVTVTPEVFDGIARHLDEE